VNRNIKNRSSSSSSLGFPDLTRTWPYEKLSVRYPGSAGGSADRLPHRASRLSQGQGIQGRVEGGDGTVS
jgi:hypothetical protein